MKTLLTFGLLAGALAVTFAAAARADDETMHEGTVVSAGGGTLVLTDMAGKQLTFKVPDSVPVTINGHIAKLNALKVGTRVRATVTRDDMVKAVNTIDDRKLAVSSALYRAGIPGDPLD